jgi:hypothetical protein
MYISLKDSCAKGFRKWADAYQPEIKNDLRASRGNGLAAASPDQDNLVIPSLERPHRPWLVPARGRYNANSVEAPPDELALRSPER